MIGMRRTVALEVGAFLLILSSLAAAQSPTPTVRPAPTPQNLAVVFESDDARDGLYEAGTDAVA